MARILIVEDDNFLRDSLIDYLKREGHNVQAAPNGRVARDVLGSNVFDCVLSDIQMPFLDGVELFKWAKDRGNPPPFILMTGFSHLLDMETAIQMGVSEFLVKPFQNHDLKKAVSKVTGIYASDKDSNPKSKPNEYCKVSIEEFVARPQIDFDVFVQIAAEKYVKIGYAGNTLPTEQIQRFKQKGLKYLYIPKEDFKKLVEFNLEVGKLIRNKNEVPAEKKMAFLKYTGEVILEKAYVAGVDKKSFQEASSLISMTVDVIGRQEETFDLVDLLNSHADFIYAHSLGVSLYSVMIARLMGFETATVFSKLAMAGMFIDIGLKEVDREVLEKPRHRQSLAERKLVETHPARGRDILLEVPSISSDIVQLVYEHHEDQLGQGYPRGINRHNCHPLSKIIQVADTFTALVLSTPHSPGRPAPEAIKYMKEVYGERLDQKALNALEELFSGAAEATADKAS